MHPSCFRGKNDSEGEKPMDNYNDYINEQQLRQRIEQIVAEMTASPNDVQTEPNAYAATDAQMLPQTHTSRTGSHLCSADTCPYGSETQKNAEDTEVLPDITGINLRTQLLVRDPKDADAYLERKSHTPARIGIGKAGARYRTATMLRVRADHAAAQDSVFSDVDEAWIERNGFVFVQTKCQDKDQYLTRPDLGRRFDEANLQIIKNTCGQNPKVLVVVGDGLSSAAIEANVEMTLPALRQGLELQGIHIPPVLFIKYARVGAMDDIGQATGAEVVCMLVGERPGLVTAESMSAYITYCPRHGIPEAKRTVISNIHSGGTTPVEAGAHAADIIRRMLEQKASGVDLK
jgi:ethanolamine ammonia-lyase small subunit